jgi:ribosome biogenesis protein ENP2
MKDHQYELPIKKIMFHDHLDLVLSMDTKILKMWDRNSVNITSLYSIESGIATIRPCRPGPTSWTRK